MQVALENFRKFEHTIYLRNTYRTNIIIIYIYIYTMQTFQLPDKNVVMGYITDEKL